MFDATTYSNRRETLLSRIEDGLVVLPANGPSPMDAAANHYAFRQDGTFRYFTGIDEAGYALVLDVDAGSATLYGEDPGIDEIIWTGPQPSLADRAEQAGISETAPADTLDEAVRQAVGNGRAVHVLPPYRAEHRVRVARWFGVGVDAAAEKASEELIRAVIAQRSRKSAAELQAIEEAVAISGAMHELAMERARPGIVEREIAGAMEGLSLRKGTGTSFPVICSVHGETLHNHHYDNELKEGDLLLTDAGARGLSGYAGDITRVTPVSGTFSDRQAQIYQVVLNSQLAAIDAMEPGVPFRDVHLLASRVIAEGLKEVGLMKGDVEEAVAAGAHALFFPHGLGHMMGIDVHDMESLGEDHVGYDDEITRSDQFGLAFLRLGRRLEEGFVVTVEPGIYFIPELIDQWAAEKRHSAFIRYDELEGFRSFGGIRIEDDVVVTETGSRILGPGIPKSIEEVEAKAQASVAA